MTFFNIEENAANFFLKINWQQIKIEYYCPRELTFHGDLPGGGGEPDGGGGVTAMNK